MGCAFDKELLTGYYDGELDGAEKAKVERHIAGCSECLRDLGEIRSVSQLVRKLSRPGLPREASEGIARALEGERAARRRDRWRRRLVWSMAAAAGVFLALNVAYFLRVERSGGREDLAPAIGHLQAPEGDETLGKRELPGGLSKLRQEGATRTEPPAAALPPSADRAGTAAPGAPPAPEPPKAAPAPVASSDKGQENLRALAEKGRPAAPEAEEKPAAMRRGATVGGMQRERAGAPAAKEELQAAPAGGVEWTVRAADPARAREQVERALRKVGVAVPETKTAPAPSAPIVVEATAEQLQRIRKELQSESGILLVLAAPEASSARKGAPADARSGADAGGAKSVPSGKADFAAAPARVRLVLHVLAAEPDKK
ncbi:MAG TPA: zf-HC2 domain-containing protein [Planctomycetota bacterium]|nr:zf-HC2 domain-containing protein [Planctomycetota bacterium]